MSKSMAIKLGGLALGAAALLSAGPAFAVTYAVKAYPYLETLADGTLVTMWGYRASAANPTAAQINTLANATTGFTSPGPALVVPPGDPTLSVTLINGLPNGHLTSLVVHGLVNGSDPVFATAAGPSGVVCTPGTGPLADQRACRLRSLTKETPNGTALANRVTYTFNSVAPGTYLYQSGTHQQLQVQMGLYGMISKEALPVGLQRYAYGSDGAQTNPFEHEIRLVFSEVDAGFHQAVAANTFGGSTIDYRPTHFRLHSYNAANAPTLLRHLAPNSSNQTISVLSTERQLVRMVNAGLTSRSPGLSQDRWQLVAEDAKPYPYPRDETGALLAAAKSLDAMVTPLLAAGTTTTGERDIVIHERRGGLTTSADGRLNGDFVRLRTGNDQVVPTLDATLMPTTGTQGVEYVGSVSASGGATPYTFSLVSAPAGMTINASTGAISWVPTNAQAQTLLTPSLLNTVTVKAATAAGRSDTATAYVAVANVNDAPVAAADNIAVVGGQIGVLAATPAPNVKANDIDPDGDVLGAATLTTAPVQTTDAFSLAADGTLVFDARNQAWYRALGAAQSTKVTFQYSVVDTSLAPSLPATVTLTVMGHKAPVAVADSASFTLSTRATIPTIDIPVLNNDSAEVGWSIVKNTLAKVGTATKGATVTVVNPATGLACTATSDCVLRYKPAAAATRGTETFSYKVSDNFGRVSNTVVVTVNIL